MPKCQNSKTMPTAMSPNYIEFLGVLTGTLTVAIRDGNGWHEEEAKSVFPFKTIVKSMLIQLVLN